MDFLSANFTDFSRLKMGKSAARPSSGATDVLCSVLFGFFLLTVVGAQPGNPPNNDNIGYPKFSPSMAVIIVVLIAALFFMGFFSIYIRHCSNATSAGGSVRRALSMRNRRAAAARGLDASVIETFPTFSYSEVKDHKIGIGTLECAVCLNEFEENETLRLIPKCDHVFHPQCIDAWLESHVTCPVCRANLIPQPADQAAPASDPANDTTTQRNDDVETEIVNTAAPRNDEIAVQIDEDRQVQDKDSASAQQTGPEYPNQPPRSWSMKIFSFGKFRSHSTGHSLVPPGENLEKFTLKLPAEMRKEMIRRASLKQTGSLAAGGSKAPGTGEGSSRGVRFYRRLEKLDTGAKSDRWVLFARGLSFKSPKVVAENRGEGSGRRNPVRMPSFNCLQEPKTGDENETHPFSNEPGRPPV